MNDGQWKLVIKLFNQLRFSYNFLYPRDKLNSFFSRVVLVLESSWKCSKGECVCEACQLRQLYRGRREQEVKSLSDKQNFRIHSPILSQRPLARWYGIVPEYRGTNKFLKASNSLSV